MPRIKGLSQKQESFVINYFQSGNATQAAILANYSPHTAKFIGSENLTKPKIKARLQELRDTAASEKIMSVVERKQKLTEFAREITESKYGIVRDGNIRAIAELNKMDNIYTTQPGEATHILQTFIFNMPDGRQLTPQEFIDANRTESDRRNAGTGTPTD